MFKKQKSKKKKIFDPYAKYFQEGGIPYNYNPLVSNEPEGVEMPMSFDPKRTTNDPEDYQQFLDYSTTAPENRRPYENYFYGNPNEYDHYGMWDALGKPKNFNQALEMNPWWEPDPYDKMYHGFSVNPNTGVFLKAGKPGESKPGDTTWMEIAGHYLSPRAQMDTPVFDPELQRFKYIPNKEKGGYVVEKLGEMQTGGPNFADSLALYNNALAKIKFYSNNPDYIKGKPSADDTDFKSSKVRKKLINNPTIPVLSSDKKVTKELVNDIVRYAKENKKPLTAAEKLALTKQIGKQKFGKVPGTNLTSFGDILDNDPDFLYNPLAPPIYLHPAITPQGTESYGSDRFSDASEIPYYAPLAIKPAKMLTDEEFIKRFNKYGPSGLPKSRIKKLGLTKTNTADKEQLVLHTLPAKPIDLNIGTPEIIPQNLKYSNIKPGVVLPDSREQWKQNPATGTWYRIERPVDPRLSPTYNPGTGSYAKGGFQDDVNKRRRVLEDWTYGKDIGMTYVPKAQEGIVVDKGTLPEAKVTHASPQWVQDKKKYGKDKISWWEAPFNWKKWGLNDYSDYSSFNSAFRNAREAGEKEFVYDRERYNTDLIDTKQSDLYWKSKKFLKEYYKDQPILKNELDNLKNDYLKQKHGTTWTEYYAKVKDTKDYNEWDKPRHKEIRDSLDMVDPYLLRSDDPNFLKYANKRKYQKQIKDLDNPVYFSITDIKPKDMSEDGYWDPQNNKMFMTTKADPGKLQTTYIHELSHKADDAIDLMDKVPKIDINAFNKSAFSNDFTQADFDYVSDPSEIEARKLSTLFYLSQSGKQYKPGKITQEMLDSLYDDYFDDKLPYDIEQLLALYGAQSEDLLNYLNSNYGGYKK